MAPTEERAAAGPQFPYSMRNTATAYASSASTNVAAYEDLPGHHLLVVRNLIATTNDESYHGSASELHLATSHGYAEWDFSSVPDPVMFQWFLNVADYWFGCSDDSSAGSYDPARECFMVAIGDLADGANVAGAGKGEAPRIWGRAHLGTQGQIPRLDESRRTSLGSVRSQAHRQDGQIVHHSRRQAVQARRV
jgi:hypothetical protein